MPLIAFAILASCKAELSVHQINRQAPQPAEPLRVVAVDPAPGAAAVHPGTPITITFSREVDGTTLGAAPISLDPADCGEALPGFSTLSDDGLELKFFPGIRLETPSVSYRVSLDPAIRAADGAKLSLGGAPVPSEFTTSAQDLSPLTFGGIESGTALSAISIRVGWSPAADVATPPDDFTYRVYLGPAADEIDFTSAKAVSDPGATEVLVTGLLPGTLYFLVVRAVDRVCREATSNAALGVSTLAEADTVPPTFAGAHFAQATSPTSILVGWDPASDNVDASANIRYRVFASLVSGTFDFSTPDAVVQGAVTAELQDLTPERDYFFVVRAVDTSDNSDSNRVQVSARTPAQQVSFSQAILPTLKDTCGVAGCHGGRFPKLGLNLTTYDGVVNDTVPRDAPVVVKSQSAASLIVWRTDPQNSNFRQDIPGWRMPQQPSDPLPSAFIEELKRWIDQGAPNN